MPILRDSKTHKIYVYDNDKRVIKEVKLLNVDTVPTEIALAMANGEGETSLVIDRKEL